MRTRNYGYAALAFIVVDLIVNILKPPAIVTDSLVFIGFTLGAIWSVKVIKASKNIFVWLGAGLVLIACVVFGLAGALYGMKHL